MHQLLRRLTLAHNINFVVATFTLAETAVCRKNKSTTTIRTLIRGSVGFIHAHIVKAAHNKVTYTTVMGSE
ncbi:MAG: hypothetical protein CL608_16345 [Anaerolineaceae bacterium]|nr:hypothetical protein [Anaerolineaceae bacterium]